MDNESNDLKNIESNLSISSRYPIQRPAALFNSKQTWELLPRRILGIKKYNGYEFEFLSDNIIVYPTGYYLAVYNIKEDTAKYIPLGSEFNISNNFILLKHKKVALEQYIDERAANIVFLNIEDGKVLKTISNIEHNHIWKLKLSPNGKTFITCLKDTWTLNLWLYDNLELCDSVILFDPQIYPYKTINEILYYPNDDNKLLVYGRSVLDSYSIINERFKLDWSIAYPGNILSHAWISDTHLIVGNDAGELSTINTDKQLYESSFSVSITSKSIYDSLLDEDLLHTVKDLNSYVEIENSCEKRIDSFFKNLKKVEIRSIIKFSAGFICLINKNDLYVYKQNDVRNFERTSHVCKFLPDKNLSYTLKQNEQTIEKIMLNKSETTLIAFTNWNRLYKIDFKNEYELSNQLTLTLIQSYHFGKVVDIDVCLRKPYIVTCSQDRLMSIWNYETGKQVFYKELDEKLYSICIHPTGFYVAIGSFEKLHFYAFSCEDIKLLYSFNVEKSSKCSFSNDGLYLAAINGNFVSIFCTTGYTEKNTIKLRSGRVRDFQWTYNDQHILVCSNYGVVSLFDVNSGEKTIEYITKRTAFLQLSIHRNSVLETIFLLDSNQDIRKLSIQKERLTSNSGVEISIDGTNLIVPQKVYKNEGKSTFTTISCDYSGYVTCFGRSDGKLLAKIDSCCLIEKLNDENLFHGHTASVTKAKFTFNDQYFVSCSEDGMIIIWDVYVPNTFQKIDEPIKSDDFFDFSTEAEAKSQRRESKSIKKENEEYETKLLEMSHNEELKAINGNFSTIIAELKNILVQFQKQDEDKTNLYQNKLKKLNEIFENDLQNMTDRLEKNLIKKYHELDNLTKIYNNIIRKREETAKASKENRESQLIQLINKEQELQDFYKNSMNELNRKHSSEIKICQYKIDLQLEENKQTEIDGDQEIVDTKRFYEKRIDFFKANNESLKLENYFMRKKLNDNEQRMKELLIKDKKLKEFFVTNKHRDNELRDRIFNLKQTLNLRELELNEEDQKVMELKHQVQYKEKLRLINEHKIKEYFHNIEPLKANNQQLKEKTIELEGTLMETNDQLMKLRSRKERYLTEYHSNMENLKIAQKLKFRTDTIRTFIENTLTDLIELKIEAPDKLRDYIYNAVNKLPCIDSYAEVGTGVLKIVTEQKQYLNKIVYDQKIQQEEEEKMCQYKVFQEIQEGAEMIRKYDINKKKKIKYKQKLNKIKTKIFGHNANELNSRLGEQLKQMIAYFKLDNVDDAFEADKNSNLMFLQLNIIKKLERQCRIVARNLFQLYSQSNSCDINDLKEFLCFIDSQ